MGSRRKPEVKPSPTSNSSNNIQADTNLNYLLNMLESFFLYEPLIDELSSEEIKDRNAIKHKELYGRDKSDSEKTLEEEVELIFDEIRRKLDLGEHIDTGFFNMTRPKIELLTEIIKDTQGRFQVEKEYVEGEEIIERKNFHSAREKFIEDLTKNKTLKLEKMYLDRFDLANSVKILEEHLHTKYKLEVLRHGENEILEINKKYIVGLSSNLTCGYYDPIKNEIHYQECSSEVLSRDRTKVKLEIINKINQSRKGKPQIANGDPGVSERTNEVIDILSQKFPHEINKTKFHELLHAVTYSYYIRKDNSGMPIPCSSTDDILDDNVKVIILKLCQMGSNTYLKYPKDLFQSEIITHLNERLISSTNGKLKDNLKDEDYLNFEAIDTGMIDKKDFKNALEIIRNSVSSFREACIHKFPSDLRPLLAIQSLIINDAQKKIEELKKLQKGSSLDDGKENIANNPISTPNTKELQKWVERIERMHIERNNNWRDN